MVSSQSDQRLGKVFEVDQQSAWTACGFQIIQQLGSVLIRQLLHGFEFDDDLLVADQVGDVGMHELSPTGKTKSDGFKQVAVNFILRISLGHAFG